MAIPVWAVGQVLSANDVNTWFIPVAVIKPADTGRNTTTTVADDPDLILPVAANATYHINGVFFYNGASSAADIKYTFTIPASASGQLFIARQNVSGSFTGSFASLWTDTSSANTTGTSTTMALAITGLLAVAAASGNLTFRWAQNTSNGTNTKVLAQSYLAAQRIG